MARSQDSFNKKEKEKKRRKKKKEKQERREQRKLDKEEGGKKTFEEMIMYVDADGNLTSEKPDPTKRKKFKLEDMIIGVPPKDDEAVETVRRGRVKFFNHEKGYGFITDSETKDGIFVHINNCNEDIHENDKVTFEVEMGPKGPNAINVSIEKDEPKPPPAPKADPKAEAEGAETEGVETKVAETETAETDGAKTEAVKTEAEATEVVKTEAAETTKKEKSAE